MATVTVGPTPVLAAAWVMLMLSSLLYLETMLHKFSHLRSDNMTMGENGHHPYPYPVYTYWHIPANHLGMSFRPKGEIPLMAL